MWTCCQAKAHDRACSPDWSPGVAGRQWAHSEGRKAGFCGNCAFWL